MKKGLLIAGLCLLALGFGLSWVGRAMGGATEAEARIFGHSIQVRCGDMFVSIGVSSDRAETASGGAEAAAEESAPAGTAVVQKELEAFTEVEVDLELGNVILQTGETYGMELDWWGDGYTLDYLLHDDGTLEIWSESSALRGLSMSDCGARVVITVPEEAELEDLTVYADLGDVELDGIAVQTAELTLDLGSLTGRGVTVSRSADVEADLGDVELSGDLRGKTVVNASLGSVSLDLEGAESEYCYDLSVDLGKLTVNGRDFESEVSGGRGDDSLEVYADLGDVNVTFSDS